MRQNLEDCLLGGSQCRQELTNTFPAMRETAGHSNPDNKHLTMPCPLIALGQVTPVKHTAHAALGDDGDGDGGDCGVADGDGGGDAGVGFDDNDENDAGVGVDDDDIDDAGVGVDDDDEDDVSHVNMQCWGERSGDQNQEL